VLHVSMVALALSAHPSEMSVNLSSILFITIRPDVSN
jgi:hypothetical protein